MQKLDSRVASMLVSTVVAATVTVALGWPSHVNAIGNEEQAVQQQAALATQESAPANAALPKNGSKIGDLEVTATLVASESLPGRQAIRLECKNPTDGRIAGKVQVALTRTTGNSMERVMPRPQIAWRQIETVELEPGGSLVREVALPKNIGAEVARIEKARKAAEESETARYPNVYFDAIAGAVDAVNAVGAPSQGPRSLVRKPSKLSMMLPSNRNNLGY